MFPIDIGKIVRSRCGFCPPSWILSPLRRLLHEEEINALLEGGKGMSEREFLQYVFRYFHITYTLHGELPPSHNRYIFVANHPFGGMDGMMLAEILLKNWDDVGVVVNDMLMHIEPLRGLWIPVNKFGRQRVANASHYNEALHSATKQVLTFPAGLCSRLESGRVADLKWSSRFVKDAVKSERLIIPVRVCGALSSRFYNIYRLRQFLGIRANVELLFLVDEMFRQRRQHIHIHIGRPINPLLLTGDLQTQCAFVRQKVESLA